MKYLIYKTTNTKNDKIYIGAHTTENIDDGYLGSGVVIKQAIKKYGKKSFKREILFYFDNIDDMYAKEMEIVDSEFISRTDTYNLCEGGLGGRIGFKQSKESIDKTRIKNKEHFNKPHIKKELSNRAKNTWTSDKILNGIRNSKKHKETASDNMIKLNENKWSDENRENSLKKLKQTHCKKFVVIAPNMLRYYVTEMRDFAERFSLSYKQMLWAAKNNKQHKGYTVRYA